MSLNVSEEAFKRAVKMLKSGKVIAYPTEAVYGLGCDINNKQAVKKIINIKKRAPNKGLIIIASDIEQLKPYIGQLTEEQWKILKTSWPGPHTWVVPKSNKLLDSIHGDFDSVAVRVTAHPVARKLCELFGSPIVSTSANVEGDTPLKDNIEVYQAFGDAIDYIVPGRVGDNDKPTSITDLITGNIIRS